MCSCFDVCLEFLCGQVGVASVWQAEELVCRDNCFSLPHGYHPNPATPKLQTHIGTRTHNQCGDRTEKSQAPDDGCINVRNMLSTEEVK